MNNLYDVLTRIADLQSGNGTGSNGTAPVSVVIGYTDRANFVHHDGILVKSACAKITRALVNEYEFVSMTEDGLVITGKWNQHT